jgi:endonuclease/exonuclease/phosphatase family metal-dependent hydrolase
MIVEQKMNRFDSSRYVDLEADPNSATPTPPPPPTATSSNKCLKIALGISCLTLALVLLTFSMILYEQNLNIENVESFPNEPNSPPGQSSSRSPLKIIAWNLKSFGSTKLQKPDLLQEIFKTVSFYDVILLMEIRQVLCDTDSNCDVITYFNHAYQDHHFYLSPSLGVSTYKEQYGFLVRKTLTFEFGNYIDPNQKFWRKPYYVYIDEYQINLSVVHICASCDAVQKTQEINELARFFESVQGDLILMGDLNICTPPGSYSNLDIWTGYHWILDNQEKTNIKGDCAYDRIITRTSFKNYQDPSVIRSSSLSSVSDHYPIAITVL